MEFLNPGLLYLLPIASAPIIIHLLSRFRLKIIKFPTIQFLYTSKQKRLSWLRIRDILLLALRTLILISIILALARPRIKKARYINDIHLIIDDSYSMEPIFNLAKEEAIKIINSYDVVAVRSLSESLYSVGRKKDLVESVKKMAITNKHLTIADLKGGGTRLLISDLTIPLILDAEVEIGTTYTILIENKEKNLQIYDVSPEDPIIEPGFKNHIKAKVRNIGKDKSEITISLFVGDREEMKKAKVDPNQLGSIIFDTPFERPGTYQGWVEMKVPDIKVDNKRFLTLRIPERLRIGIFYKDLTGTNYLKAAMQTASFQYNLFEIERMGKLALEQYDMIILYGIDRIESWTAKIVKTWINQKKPIVIFMRGKPEGHLYDVVNELIEPIAWEKGISQKTIKFNRSHPITRFEKTYPKVKQYLISKVKRGYVLAWVGQDPLLTIDQNTVLCNTGLSLEDTDLPLKNIFIPLFYRLISYITSGGSNQYTVGERLKIANYDIAIEGPKGTIIARGGIFTPQYPGIYYTQNRTIAVNVDPEEGNVKKISPEVLRKNRFVPFREDNMVYLPSLLVLLAIILLAGEIILLSIS